MSATGRNLASTSTPAGSALPWDASLTWTDRSWTTAGLVAKTTSLKDGSVTRVAVVTVRRGSSAGSTFAGLNWNGSSLVWTRGQQTGCADELDGQTVTLADVMADGSQLGRVVRVDGATLTVPCAERRLLGGSRADGLRAVAGLVAPRRTVKIWRRWCRTCSTACRPG